MYDLFKNVLFQLSKIKKTCLFNGVFYLYIRYLGYEELKCSACFPSLAALLMPFFILSDHSLASATQDKLLVWETLA